MKKPNIPSWARTIADFEPKDALEAADRARMLEAIERLGEAILFRESEAMHMTASSIIVNPARTKTLMAYHKIYDSWAWTGGHCDGEGDFLAVALREAQEETGVRTLRPLGNGAASLEILDVPAHVKRGKPVPVHLHFNVSFLFEAEEGEALRVCEDENSAVEWLPIAELRERVCEKHMLPFYERLLRRANVY